MNDGLTALGIACLIVWGGLWFYMYSLQRRLDALEAEHEDEGAREREGEGARL